MSKGLQRRVVIVVGFNRLYFKFFAKSSDPNVCPETFYVGTWNSGVLRWPHLPTRYLRAPLAYLPAASRAYEELHLCCEDDPDDRLAFLDLRSVVAAGHVLIKDLKPSKAPADSAGAGTKSGAETKPDVAPVKPTTLEVRSGAKACCIPPIYPQPTPQAQKLTEFLDDSVIRGARSLLVETLHRASSTHIVLQSTAPGLVEAPSLQAINAAAAQVKFAEGIGAVAPAAGLASAVPSSSSAAAAPDLPPPVPCQTTEEVRDLNGLAIPAMLEAAIRLSNGAAFRRPIRSGAGVAKAAAAACPAAPRSAAPDAPACSDMLFGPTREVVAPCPVPQWPPMTGSVTAALSALPESGRGAFVDSGGGWGCNSACDSAQAGYSSCTADAWLAAPMAAARLPVARHSAQLPTAEALRRGGGLCAMLDALEENVQNRTVAKGKRRKEMEARDEFAVSLREINAELVRAAADPSLTWDPEGLHGGGGSSVGVRIPRPSFFLRLASLYQAWRGGYISKHRQLLAFDWMDETAAAACIAVARDLIPDLGSGSFEFPLSCAQYEWSSAERGIVLHAEEVAVQAAELGAPHSYGSATGSAVPVLSSHAAAVATAAAVTSHYPSAAPYAGVASRVPVASTSACLQGLPASVTAPVAVSATQTGHVILPQATLGPSAVARPIPVVIEGLADLGEGVGSCFCADSGSVDVHTRPSTLSLRPSHAIRRLGAQVRRCAARGALLAACHLCLALGGWR